MMAPAAWIQADARPLRGCSICTHGRCPSGDPSRQGPTEASHCACPDVAGQVGKLPVQAARANAGPCGPEARHLRFPGLVG